MQKVYLASFGDTRLGISICRFKQEAESMGVFDDIFIYTEASLPLDFKEAFKDKFYVQDSKDSFHYNTGGSRTNDGRMISRGFGYWCWKPKVILMALEQICEGDLLIYCDIGFEFCPPKKEELLDMLKQTDKNEAMGLVVNHCIEQHWQKGDTLDYFGLSDDEEFLKSKQIAAGMIFLKKSKKTMDMISEWMDIFYYHYDFVNDEPSKLPNKEGFQRNSHDLAIFSILMKKYKGKTFPTTFYYERQWGAHALLCNRNKIFLPSNINETKYFNNQILQGGKRGKRENTFHIKTFVAEYKKLKAQSTQQKLPKYLTELNNAKSRIHNHLAYKLGNAMILNARSLLGWVRMPFVLSFIKESHREEQRKYQERVAKNPSLKLPKLESYPDYKEALKEKQCFTYKLGEALIAVNSAGGGGEYLLICDSSKKRVS